MEQNVFSQNTVEQAVNVIKEHEAAIKAMKEKTGEMPLADVAQELLMERFGISQIEAEEIVVDLKAGIENFDNQYKATVEQGRISVVEQLAEKAEDLSDEERVDYYANILTALQLLGKEDLTEDMVTAKQKENASKTAEELATEIEAMLNAEISLDALADAVQNSVNKEALNEIAKKIEMKKDDYRFLVALWLYIDQREGKIQFTDSEVKIPTATLGVLAGASIEALIATNDLNEGKIDLKRWQVVMKWILGTVFALSAVLLVGFLGVYVGAFLAFFILATLGANLFACIVGILLAVGLGWYLSDIVENCFEKSLDYLSKVYDKYIVVLTDKVSKWFALFKEWVARLSQKPDDPNGPNGDTVGNLINEAPSENSQVNEGRTEETFVHPQLA